MQILLTPKEAIELISLINEDAKKLIKENIEENSETKSDFITAKDIENINAYVLFKFKDYNLEYLHYNANTNEYEFNKNKCICSTNLPIVFFDSIEYALELVKLHPEFKEDNIKLKIGKVLNLSNNEIFGLETHVTVDDMYQ